jgi:uncharacterized protein YndB with AHSA1/START domain
MKIHKTIEIKAPPEKIWPLLIEPEKIMKWCYTLKSFRYTGDQCAGAGATFRYEEKGAVRETGVDCLVTEWIENRKLSFKMTAATSLKRYEETWVLEPNQAGSTFSFIQESELPYGIIGKLMASFSFRQRRAEAVVDKMLARLKGEVE